MQTNYSLIHYNIYNISPMQILFIHHTSKPVILCKPMKTILSIRFYPKHEKKIVEVTKNAVPKIYDANNAAASNAKRYNHPNTNNNNTHRSFKSRENNVPRADSRYTPNTRENNNFCSPVQSWQERHANNPAAGPFGRFWNSSRQLRITDGREDPTYSDLKAVQDRKTQEANHYRKAAEERANQPGNTPALLLITDGKENSTYAISKTAQELTSQPPKNNITNPKMVAQKAEYSSITDNKPGNNSSHIPETNSLTTSTSENTSSSVSTLIWDDMADFIITPVGLMTTANVLIQDPTKNIITNDKLMALTMERENMRKEPATIESKLIILHQYGLSKVEDHEKKHNFGLHINYRVDLKFLFTDYTLTKKFYDSLNNTPIGYSTVTMINLTIEDINNIKTNFLPRVGFLCIEEKHTRFPTGMQNHTAVYHRINNVFLVFSYLTSHKDDNVLLTSYQPFDTNPSKRQDQMLHILKRPFIITASPLEPPEGNNLTQDIIYMRRRTLAVGNKYVLLLDVSKIIKDNFIAKTLPQLSREIPVYDGTGASEYHIDTALNNFEAENKQQAAVLFKKNYSHFINNIMSAEKAQIADAGIKAKRIASAKYALNHWITNTERSYPHIYMHIKVLIDHYNDQNNAKKSSE